MPRKSATHFQLDISVERDLQGLPDLISPDLRVLFCGVNPGLGSARAQQHFHNPSNRFWRVMHQAGFTPRQLEPSESARILEYGCGLTTAVARPTVTAEELRPHEFADAAATLKAKVEHYRPEHLAFIGKTAYSGITKERSLSWGRQRQCFGGAIVWVLPNTSGLNRTYHLDDLITAYRQLYTAAFA